MIYRFVIVSVFLFFSSHSVLADKRVALLIGIAKYEHLSTLHNTVRDVDYLAQILQANGFKVYLHKDVNQKNLKQHITEFQDETKDAEEAIVFYSGHGMAVVQNGDLQNIIAPSDARISCQTRSAQNVVAMETLFSATQHIKKRVFIFDACRNNPYLDCKDPVRNSGAGFTVIKNDITKSSTPKKLENQKGYIALPARKSHTALIAYSTDINRTASDGEPGKNSPFAKSLFSYLKQNPRRPIREVLDLTSKAVKVETALYQVPWVLSKGGDLGMCLSGRNCETSDELKKQQEAEKSKKLIQESQRLTEAANNAIKQGDMVTAMQLSLESLRDKTNRKNVQRTRPFYYPSHVSLDTAFRKRFERKVLLGHTRGTHSIAFSPDGKILATGGAGGPDEDNIIRLWNSKNGKLLTKLKGHYNSVNEIVFSHDGKFLISGSSDRSVIVWDLKKREKRNYLYGHKYPVTSVALSPNGNTIAYTTENKVYLWNINDGSKRIFRSSNKETLNSVRFSPDGRLIASGSWDKTVHLWDFASGRQLASLGGHTSSVKSVVFSPDGKILASGDGWHQRGAEYTVRLWDVEKRKLLKVLRGHTGLIHNIQFSLDGKMLASASGDQTIRLWDVIKGRLKDTLKGHVGDVTSIAFSPDGKSLVSGSWDFTVRFWDIEREFYHVVLRGSGKDVSYMKFSSDSKTLATSSRGKSIDLWSVFGGNKLHDIKVDKGAILITLARSPDNKLIAVGSKENKIFLWDLSKNKLLRVLEGHESGVKKVIFSPDGKSLISGSFDNSVILWDIVSGKVQLILRGHNGPINDLAYSPDGRTLASASSDQTVRMWDSKTGKLKQIFNGYSAEVHSVVFSPDGEMLATGSSLGIRLRSLKTGAEQSLKGHTSGITHVVFSPDGKILASSSWDWTIRLWDVKDGSELAALRGSNGVIRSIAYAPNGKLLASGPLYNNVRIWNIEYQKQSLINKTKDILPRCLTPKQRKELNLRPEPPYWCITGYGNDIQITNPSTWKPKWPYNDTLWKNWMLAKLEKKNLPLPGTKKSFKVSSISPKEIKQAKLDVEIMERKTTGRYSGSCMMENVAGLSRKGFLAVRTGPDTSFKKIDELYNGDIVYTFERRGQWVGIVYGVSTLSCPSKINKTRPLPYTGKKGWVHSKWLRPFAG